MQKKKGGGGVWGFFSSQHSTPGPSPQQRCIKIGFSLKDISPNSMVFTKKKIFFSYFVLPPKKSFKSLFLG